MSELTDLQAQLQLYLDAKRAILEVNQGWSSPDAMQYTREDLGKVQLAADPQPAS